MRTIHIILLLVFIGMGLAGAINLAYSQNCSSYTASGQTYTNCIYPDGSTRTCTTYTAGGQTYTNCQ